MLGRSRSPFASVVDAALDEARRRGNRRLGTEHLLLGLLRAPESPAARAFGVDLGTARSGLDLLDREALASIGIRVGDILDPEFAPHRHPAVRVSAVTSTARATLGKAVRGTTVRTRHVAPARLLTALLDSAAPDPVADLIRVLGVDRDAVRRRLEASG
ncbi:Clp protease N-terminal domain-containing protein [Spongiactinospora sp. TRM90649]|uniref:Clp protease N-terminal domain-containing protein n=1 Tax=Spongiactinospora sp. TRM90649 TaxID=3031114 RepID=UPI0023F87407|nr:Clp protease N-terminal domain-containing protein [Spongiactinospora sp. TRM90649]MDF5753221.1 Clp protease N-terminal domain-containing protein [Spongiactinospora sp. TRM90649]